MRFFHVSGSRLVHRIPSDQFQESPQCLSDSTPSNFSVERQTKRLWLLWLGTVFMCQKKTYWRSLVRKPRALVGLALETKY